MAWKSDGASSAKWQLENTVWRVGNTATKIIGLIAYNVAWAKAYLRTKWHLDPSSCLATTDMGWKLRGCASFGGAGSPQQCGQVRGLPPYAIPSGILIHPAVWPQQTWTENWGAAVPLWGELGSQNSPSNTMWWGQGLPLCQVSSWSIQPFGHNRPTSQTEQTPVR